MDYWTLSAIRSFMFIGVFLAVVCLFVPKSVKHWQLWKETGKSVHVSNFAAFVIGSFFGLTIDFIILIQDVWR
jgi:hypothetical protein